MLEERQIKGMLKGQEAIKCFLSNNFDKEIILYSDGINWIWYCHVIISRDGFAKVVKEYRLHRFDDYQGARIHPKGIDHYKIIENSLDDSRKEGRIAYGIAKGNCFFPFRNPVKRFSLKETK